MDYDYLFKIIVIGASGVGKTSLLCRYVDSTFPESHMTTIGVDHKIKTNSVEIDGITKCAKLQLWDTAGQERFNAISAAYFRGAHGIILVFAIDDEASFKKVPYWLEEIDDSKVPYKILIGNKCDLPKEKWVIRERRIRELCNEEDMDYIETSAKTGESVHDAFETLTRVLVKRMQAHKNHLHPNNKGVIAFPRLPEDEPGEAEKKSGCCK
jgi:Ras-related protein Rab-1A